MLVESRIILLVRNKKNCSILEFRNLQSVHLYNLILLDEIYQLYTIAIFDQLFWMMIVILFFINVEQ